MNDSKFVYTILEIINRPKKQLLYIYMQKNLIFVIHTNCCDYIPILLNRSVYVLFAKIAFFVSLFYAFFPKR